MTNPPITIKLEKINCPLCDEAAGREIVKTVDNQWGIAGTFSVTECSRCRHRFMNPRPTIATLGDCYPSDYGPHQLTPQTTTATEAVDAFLQSNDQPAPTTPWYLRYLPLRYIPGLRSFYGWLIDEQSQILPSPFCASAANDCDSPQPQAMELGCAAGEYLSRLQAAGWNVQGVEPGEGPVQIARSAGLSVHHGTLDSAPAANEFFDFVASWMVIEHVPNPRITLTQMFERLKPGGLLAISVPNAGCWEPSMFGANWDAWELPRHLHHFTPRSIRELLSECGFTDIRIIHQRTLLNVFGSIGIAITRRRPQSRIGQWFLRYPHSPTLAVQLVAAPIAQLLAFFRQGGRLTISARRPRHSSITHANSAAVQKETT